MAKQLPFDLPRRTALGRADFLVSPSNTIAVSMIENWRDWTGRKLVLCGPEASGKTHLAQVWAGRSNARVIDARTLKEQDIPSYATGCVAVEDVHRIAADPKAQDALFHLHNLVLAEGHALLLTGQGAPAHWGLTLPDLASRVAGTQTALLEPPDDRLLAAVLAKLFADRQIMPKPDVIPYLADRIERSFAAARDVVERLDAAALEQKRALTRSFAAQVLDSDADNAR